MKVPFWRSHQQQDLDAELQSHLQMAIQDRIARGETPEQAEARARSEFGNESLVKDVTRQTWGWTWLADSLQDVHYGLRMLRKNPGFTVVAVLTLALAIGANTAVFTVLNTIFLHSLPVHEQSHLVAVKMVSTSKSKYSDGLLPISFLNLKDLQDQNRVFSGLAGYSLPCSLTLWQGRSSQRVFAEIVTGNYFEVLGISPAVGSFFVPEEDRAPGANPAAVISYGLWQRRFGGTPGVIGREIRLSQATFTIVGVAPQGFLGVNAVFGPDVWLPSNMAEQVQGTAMRGALSDRGKPLFTGLGRLRPGITSAKAESDLRTIAASQAKEYPGPNAGHSVALQAVSIAALGPYGTGILFGSALLMTLVGLVLLIACSNVANLLMARAEARRHEIAVRISMGARRLRLIRQLLTESVLLGLASGICGLLLGYAGVNLLGSMRPAEYAQNLTSPKLDVSVFVFTLVLSLLTGLIFGIVPALESSRAPVLEVLKEASRGVTGSRRRIGFANVLLVGQVALSLAALIMAALFLRSVQRQSTMDPGFQTRNLAVFPVNPGQVGYDRARSENFYRRATADVSVMPGIESVSWASNFPLWGRVAADVVIEDRAQQSKSDTVSSVGNTIDLNYFSVMGIGMVRGRDFTASDDDHSLPVVIVNETMARSYWPNQEVLGKRFRFASENFYRQIVGVVKNSTYLTLGEQPQPCIYLPLRQNFSDAMVLYVRTRGDPAQILTPIERQIHEIDPQMPLDDVRTGSKIIGQAMWGTEMGVGMLTIFGLLGLLLASVGLYGIMSYSVNQRRHEIGIRMALGANRTRVLQTFVIQGMKLVGIGVLVGLALAVIAGRAVSSLLYGVSAADPISIALASTVLVLVAALACLIPARAATRVDPLTSLRES
jgi:putative ABC transport system permease protein